MIEIYEIIGQTNDDKISNKLHDLSHQNKVEYIKLDHNNLKRKRFRAKTDKGTDCAISLFREQNLENGSVLYLDENRAIVVKMAVDEWLSLKPIDIAAAIELGYFAGNMHWRVKMGTDHLDIALDSPKDIYLDRLKEFFNQKKIMCLNND